MRSGRPVKGLRNPGTPVSKALRTPSHCIRLRKAYKPPNVPQYREAKTGKSGDQGLIREQFSRGLLILFGRSAGKAVAIPMLKAYSASDENQAEWSEGRPSHPLRACEQSQRRYCVRAERVSGDCHYEAMNRGHAPDGRESLQSLSSTMKLDALAAILESLTRRLAGNIRGTLLSGPAALAGVCKIKEAERIGCVGHSGSAHAGDARQEILSRVRSIVPTAQSGRAQRHSRWRPTQGRGMASGNWCHGP